MAEPFLKWVGGKRQLLDVISRKMPRHFSRYYEPFLGGGAVFFRFLPKRAFINDSNQALMNTYQQIRDNCHLVLSYLSDLDQALSAEFYYFIRSDFNARVKRGVYDASLAAEMIFLNKHCFNGLFRVNKKGEFNAPFNGSKVSSFNRRQILDVSHALQDAFMTCKDFEEAVSDAGADDFVFFDSPYAPLNPTSFRSYTKEGFKKEDHIRLAEVFTRLVNRGAYCMLTNHNTPFIRELYREYHQEVLPVKRMINRDAKHRVGEEIIITNFL